MPPMINYLTLPPGNGLVTSVDANFQSNHDGKYVEYLWEKVCLNDLDSLEQIHALLYPLLFKYAFFITQSSDSADEIIADAFIDLWYQKSEVTGTRLKIDLVKYIRRTVTFHLTYLAIDCKEGLNKKMSESTFPEILLSVHNSLGFKKREIVFLKEHLKLDYIAIAEIMDS